MSADDQSDQESIAKLAYFLWESRGRPAGSAEQDWLDAAVLFAADSAANRETAGSPDAIPTLDKPARVRTERAKPERRRSRAKKDTTQESDSPKTP